VLQTIAVQNYRSLHDLRLPLSKLTLVTGANGAGKSSLYRALRLLADCGAGRVIGSLAREGGLQSALWAGPEVIAGSVRRGEFAVQGTTRSKPVSVQLGFAADPFSYLVDLGIPPRSDTSAFNLDPEIKRELIWSGPEQRPATLLLRRKRGLAEVRGPDGGWTPVSEDLRSFDSVLTELSDPGQLPEVSAVRERIRSWRFYDHLRTDDQAPARQPQIGTRTFVLDHDGRDLAAALQTIIEIGDAQALERTVTDAFPGSRLWVSGDGGRFDVQLQGAGLLRPLSSAELSDGTLRYLLWVAALLSPRPPSLMVVNEPETSLHPDLLAPLARLIASATGHTQLVVVTHSPPLIAALAEHPHASLVELVKDLGETQISGQTALGRPPWTWGSR